MAEETKQMEEKAGASGVEEVKSGEEEEEGGVETYTIDVVKLLSKPLTLRLVSSKRMVLVNVSRELLSFK